MEHLNNVTPNVNDCPSLCVAKALVGLLIAAFVVCLPLGDPAHMPPINIKESIKNAIPIHKVQSDVALGCVCDFYNDIFIKYARKGSDALNVLTCVVKEITYDAKLTLYAVLEKLDGNDLCNTVCCPHIPDDDNDSTNKQPKCRCLKNCCKQSNCPTT